jgi:hopanoid C-3 methylase
MAPARSLRILLVKPNPTLGAILGLQQFSLLEPLELGYVAAAVPAGHEVRVLDLRLERSPRRSFLSVMRRFRPDIVGFTGYTHEAATTKRLARLARELTPSVTIVAGGHHATVAPRDYDLDTFDAVVRGDGTGPFRAIVEAVERGEPVRDMPNVITRGSDAAAAGWPVYPNPADLPSPRRDLWDSRRYRSVWLSETKPFHTTLFPRVSLVRSSWGCRMKCSFCIVPMLSRGIHNARPVDVVADEIAAAPADHIYFVDDENFIDPAHGWELAEAIERRGVRKRYFAWTRSTTVNNHADLLRRWREIGLDGVFIGFEFSTDAELKGVQKGGTVRGNEEAVDRLRAMGIAVHAAFLVMPEWTRDDFARLRAYVRSLPPVQCSFTVCSPSPGTPDFAAIEPDIWVDDPYRIYDCMHPLTPTSVPLREFAGLYARQAAEGLEKVPLRANRCPSPPWDLARAWIAGKRYERGFRELYRDYPRELWDA